MRRTVAKGRVFPQSYSTDRRIGRLSIKAIALFPLMWANADDQGRLCGDPDEIKYAVCPNIDHIAKIDIPELLGELEANMLVKTYQTENTQVTQMLDWWEIHKPQWAWPSEYPRLNGWVDHLRYKKGASEVVTENWPPVPNAQMLDTKSVYLIVDKASNAVKIGVAESPKSRLESLQASTPHKLVLAKVIKTAGYKLERDLHKRFEGCSLGNEWFQLTPAIQAYISGENSGERSGENTTQRETERNKNKNKETEEEEGSSPEDSGERLGTKSPSPSPTGLPKTQKISQPANLDLATDKIRQRLNACFSKEWGPHIAGTNPPKFQKRKPTAKEHAQLRDLAIELSAAGGCPLETIPQAFAEAAAASKMHISYVRAILLDWLGVARDHPDKR